MKNSEQTTANYSRRKYYTHLSLLSDRNAVFMCKVGSENDSFFLEY